MLITSTKAGGERADPAQCLIAVARPVTESGRALPAVNVGCLAAQFGRQVSDGKVDGVAVSGRPGSDLRCPDYVASKLSVEPASRHTQRPRSGGHTSAGGNQGASWPGAD